MKTLLAASVFAVLFAAPAYADFNLDSRYSDEDGDLVADIPTNEDELVDPDTLIFTYTPVEDPAVYEDVWQGFMEHMSEVTGKEVEFFPVQSNAAQLEAMRAGRLHVAGFNTGSNPIAVACAGFRPFAMMAAEDGSYGYEMEIIVPADSEAQEIEDLRGGEITFTQETSNSGFKAPSAILKGNSAWRPARISRPGSRAPTTPRSWAWPTATTRQRPSPIPS
ncbi:phosphate/phosphite/phosphonate ABC transporter substrate-binding protein [Fodinicurvata halophila]|uniref:phosphate/phosphite/phosphonate ABC transporter substrate-binding protein n=1 Tax=Fodinicurvata halophila TaxID=1419723 RepID=UPI0036263041